MSSPKRLARIAGSVSDFGIFGGFAHRVCDAKCTYPATQPPRAAHVLRTPDLSAWRHRRSTACDRVCIPRDDALRAAEGCEQERGPRAVILRRIATTMMCSTRSSNLPPCWSQPTDPTWPLRDWRARMRSYCSCSTCITTASDRANLSSPVAVPLGYLAYTSGMFPEALGVVLIVGGLAYLVDMLAAFSGS